MASRHGFGFVVHLLALVGALLLLLPLLALLVRAPWPMVLDVVLDEHVVAALELSLISSLSATVAATVLGLPLAWLLARVALPAKSLLRGIVTLPMVLPPVVGGVALLLAFGRRGLVGEPLATGLGVSIPFTTVAVVIAETFVAMPFLVITLEAGLRSMNVKFEEAARTLGASRWTVFRRVTLPLIRPSLMAGAVLAWARALGEFGATITFAGNLPGTTQTAPLAIYIDLESDRLPAAMLLSLLMAMVSLAVLVALRGRYLQVD
jgi:molybdate transport system permease protein